MFKNSLINNALTIILIFFVFLLSAHAQKKVLSKNEAIEDLEYLHYYLEKWHPSYYRYSSESNYEEFYNHFVKTCPDSIPYRLFRYRMAEWVKKIGCGHTGVGLANFNTKGKIAKILPFNIWKIGDKAFIRSIDVEETDCKVGDEILSIDNYPMSALLDSMCRIVTGDGFHQTHVHSHVELNFKFYHNHIFGVMDSVTITYKNAQGALKTEKIPCSALSPSTGAKKRFPIDTTNLVFQSGGMSLHKVSERQDVILWKIPSFNIKKQHKSRKEIFAWVKKNKIRHLIIDLRSNGGGSVFQGYSLAARLLPQEKLKVQFGKKIYTAIFHPELELDWGSRLSGISFMLNPLQFPKKGLWMHYFPIYASGKNKFKGKLYVLVDGGTFSMASSLASLLKHKGDATIIGEESGGSDYGSGGMLTGTLRTPNAAIPVSFNLYYVIIGSTQEDFGRGLMPDVETQYDIQDRLTKTDKDVEATLQLIEQTGKQE